MPKSHPSIRLLGLGLDPILSEKVKKVVKTYRLKVRVAFAAASDDMIGEKNDIDVILLQVPAHFGQALKMVQELLYRFPRSALLIVSPKSDPHLLVHFFRAGAFDVLLSPFDDFELGQALRRVSLRPGDIANPSDWTSLQAAAHFFTRPIADQWDDLADNLDRYFSLFIRTHKRTCFHSVKKVENFLVQQHGLSGPKLKKLQHFLNDQKGLFFGLDLRTDAISWTIKLAPDYICYWTASGTDKYVANEVFGTHFLNLLRGQREHYEAHLERVRMRRLALTDEITGLWNQRKLAQDLEDAVAKQKPFSLLFIDIDFFKNVNDQFGHVHGSQLLIDMADILRRELRGSDAIYRYGGDEFIVFLPETGLSDSKLTALRLANAIKAHEFTVQERPYHLSLSVGIAVYPDDAQSVRALIEFADQMMYMSKKSGRGKVFHVTEVM